jgi:hypothetical protein
MELGIYRFDKSMSSARPPVRSHVLPYPIESGVFLSGRYFSASPNFR